MKRLKVILYWISLIPPIVDIVKGAIKGLKDGLQDLRDQHERDLWDKANR